MGSNSNRKSEFSEDGSKQNSGRIPRKTKSSWVSWFALFFSGLAILLSFGTLYDSIFRSSLDFYMGKQITLYAGYFDTQGIRPVIMASLNCINYGGKTKVVEDSKLVVRISCGAQTGDTIEFCSQRQIKNIIIPTDSPEQFAVTPVPVLGKSMATRQIMYAPKFSSDIVNITDSSTVEFDLYVLYTNDWDYIGTFNIDSLRGCWQDPDQDGNIHRDICLITQIR